MNRAVFSRTAGAGRHLHGARPRGRRPSDPRFAGQHERQVVQRGALRRAARGPAARHGRDPPAWPLEHKPRLIIAGARPPIRGHWDFAAFRAIADEVGAYLLADMSHFSGLGAGGTHPRPSRTHVVTTTTARSLRGPRSGVILTNDEALAKKFNTAVFPGMQGGPLVHVIAAKAVAFGEALRPEFKVYAVRWSRTPGRSRRAWRSTASGIVSGGTDNHLDAGRSRVQRRSPARQPRAGLAPRVPHLQQERDPVPVSLPPTKTSSVRLGTPAADYAREFGPAEFRKVGAMIAEVLEAHAQATATKAMPASRNPSAAGCHRTVRGVPLSIPGR